MQGIGNSPKAHPAQSHPSENSRRPGTAGHPGKHLGQFKKAGIEANPANQSLIEQQLGSIKSSSSNRSANNAQSEQRQENSVLSITADHMNDMSDAFADQISFTSKMHAISTGLF